MFALSSAPRERGGRISVEAGLLVVLVAAAGCGSGGAGGSGSPPASPPPPTASPCPAAPAVTSPVPIGQAQALHVIHVMVTAGAATTPGLEQLGAVSCVSVGVGQQVAVTIEARIPPLPAEPQGVEVLSQVAVTPAPHPGAGVPGQYTLSFTAAAPGSTTLAYLPATCTLPPGAC